MEKPDDDAALVDARITLPPELPWPMHRDFLVALGMQIAPDAAAPPAGTTMSTSIEVTGVPVGSVQGWYDRLRALLPELELEWHPNGSLADDDGALEDAWDDADEPYDPSDFPPQPTAAAEAADD